jgi:DNA (cytosine-5)-methyltransferase 1
MNGLIVDNFAGGGGASTGIERALGRPVDIAINHDPEALAMHEANHPTTRHLCESVWDIDPVEACGGRPVELAWFSPDCTFFSKSRGGKPFRDRRRARRRRGLAWVVVRWAKAVRPRVICLENVEEFADWGPLDDDGRPDPLRRGFTFRRWMSSLRNAGYEVEMRELRACDYGAPTTRKRLFIIARCDGQPIRWPEPTHGRRAGLLPYRTAAECIDWSIPCPSIFERERPLAEATMRRIARGVFKYVLGSAAPFVVPYYGERRKGEGSRARGVDEPLPTASTARRFGLVAPTLVQTGRGERDGQAPRALDLQAPLGTVCAGGSKHALVAAFLAKHYGGNETPGASLADPMSTITTQDHHHLVQVRAAGDHREQVRAFLLAYYGTEQAAKLRDPLPTITTRDRFAVVTVSGQEYVIADIGMRMLAPHELAAAQGFPSEYQLAPVVDGKPLSKTAQIRMIGNSVCPPIAEAIVRAQFSVRAARRGGQLALVGVA